jgi:hypothetical protein
MVMGVISDVIVDLRERWRRRGETVDEWILSLDGRDLALLSGRGMDDMFWSWYRVTPLHAAFAPILLDREPWNRCRFSYRHRVSGRAVSSWSAAGDPPSMREGELRILLRWFASVDR